MQQTDWVSIIGQVGFPIAVAGYVLIRMETTIRELTKAVNLMSAKLGVPTDAAK
jgi:hypothetical protein